MYDILPTAQTIIISAEILFADPDSCKFTVNQAVNYGSAAYFNNKEQADGSPLAEKLFALSGVTQVLLTNNIVTIVKEPTISWLELKRTIGTIIRTFLHTDVSAAEDEENPSCVNIQKRTDIEIRTLIQELLDKEINRAIVAHGGKISIVDIKDENLFIIMSGGCQGCSASQMTLHQRFKIRIQKIAPEIMNIIDTTDHEAGKNPFYSIL